MSENKDGFADAWNGLFAPELENLPVDDYAQQIGGFIKTICNVLGLNETDGVPILKVSLGFDDVDDTANRLQNAIRMLTDDHGIQNRTILNSDEYAELVEMVKDLTFAEAELCLEAISDAENRDHFKFCVNSKSDIRHVNSCLRGGCRIFGSAPYLYYIANSGTVNGNCQNRFLYRSLSERRSSK